MNTTMTGSIEQARKHASIGPELATKDGHTPEQIADLHAKFQSSLSNDINSTSPERASVDRSGDVFRTFRDRCSGLLSGVDLILADAIRTAHPDCNVTPIDSYVCYLVGFAQAGHATLELHAEGDYYLHERTYAAPTSRLQGGPGTLGETVKFGLHTITFNNERFQFYTATWPEQYKGWKKTSYILSPKQSGQKSNVATAAVDNLILAVSKWTSELHGEIYVYDDGSWEKNAKLWQAVQSAGWDDVILDPAMKDTIIADVQKFFDSRPLYEEYAVPWKRGIIFHGTPGCGKTISIKALMNTLDKREQPVASLYVKTLENCRGSHYSVREIFSKAREMAPCLLVFEDLDSLVTDKIRSYFLNEVDGLEDNDGILMIGSTNHLDRLDPGISKRPSRFDRKYYFKIPGRRERILYCEYWKKKKLEKNSNMDFDPEICDVVAELTDGFSFAYLKELFVQTLLTIVGGRQDELAENENDSGAISEGELVDIAEETTVIEGSAKLAMGNEKVASNAKEDNAEVKKAKIQAPTVEIPARLQENPLMRVLHKQAQALWKDMDNSKDDEAGVRKGAEDSDDEDSDEDEMETVTRLLTKNGYRSWKLNR